MPAAGNYITQSDLEDAFGADNIAAWSNYDNDTTTANTSAITAAILKGEQWVLNRFRGSRYAVPLVCLDATADPVISDAMATAAVWFLYRGRGIRDGAAENRIGPLLDAAAVEIRKIVQGSLQINYQTKETRPVQVPSVAP